MRLFSKRLVQKSFDVINQVRASFGRETGATAVEYALIVGLIAVVIIAAVTGLGNGISDLFNQAKCAISTAC